MRQVSVVAIRRSNSSFKTEFLAIAALAAVALLILPLPATATCPPYTPGNLVVPPLLVGPRSGPAPLTVGINWAVYPVENPVRVEFDVNSDGVPEWSQSGFEPGSHTYEREGEYQFTVRVHDRSGQVTVYSTPVKVLSLPALKADLERRWASFKAALRRGDAAAALECTDSESRSRYRQVLTSLASKSPQEVDRILTTIQFVEIGPGGAQYEMLRERDGQTLSFAVWFRIDQDGIWRLRRF